MRMLLCLLGLSMASPVLAQTVVLDPGHGGGDGGATSCGLEEAEVVLDVSQRAARMLRAAGLTVHMTRTDDRFIELVDRSSFANARGANRFISIHSNSNAGTPATGTETFVYTTASSASRDMGGRIQTQMVAAWGLRDRGLKSANFSVIRRTSMPGALAELAFTNNCGVDARLLASPSERERIAAAVTRGVLGNLGISGPADPGPGDPGPSDPGPTEPPPATGGRLIGVAYVDRGAGAEDTSERIGGASARIVETGTSRTANATGTFDFALSPGTYTVEVSEDGFVTGTRTCVVSTGDAWCSVGLRPATGASGRAVGMVFEDVGAGFGDTTRRVSGAQVRIVDTGATTTTDASGGWSIGLPNGRYTLEVTKSGYATTRSACVVDGPESSCSVGVARTVVAGTLQGVAYRQGSLSTRLVGATVRIMENGAMTTSASGSGFWSFELAPGAYTVEVSGAGSLTTTRRCDVRTGGETWCSIGLPRAGGGGSALEEVVDERAPEEAAFDREDGLTVSSCSASGTGSTSPWLLIPFLFLFAGLRRKDARRSAFIATAMMVVAMLSLVVGCSEEAPRGVTAAVSQTHGEELALAQEVDSFASTADERVIAQGDYVDLTLSPDGNQLALSHARFAGLSVMPTAGGEARVLASTERSGYAPVWRADGRALGLRVAGQTDTAVPILALALDGQEVAPVRVGSPVRVWVTEEGAVVLRTAEGDETTLAPPGDTYFSPTVSPDARYVAFRGLSTGLYVHRIADGATFMVGPGAHARFAGQRWMVFERTDDDGHAVQSAELYLMDLDDDTLEFGVIAMEHEGLAEAGTMAGDTLAFLRGDDVITSRIRIRR